MQRRQTSRLLAGIAAVALIAMAAGCGSAPSGSAGKSDSAPASGGSTSSTSGSTSSGSGGGGSQGAKVRLSIATGGTGGTYYPYGGTMAKIINEYVPNAEATAEVTQASVENVRLVHGQEADLALIMGDVAYAAYTGTGKFEGQKQNIRLLFAMYPNMMQLVTLKDYDIKSAYDLVGKRVSVGAPGSGTEFMTNAVLSTLGIQYDQFKSTQRLGFSQTADALKNRTLDAGAWVVGPGTSSITELASLHEIRIIGFSQEDLAKVTAAYPYYMPGKIPGGTYPGQDEDVMVPAVWNVVVARADMDEELAYNIVKAIFEHQQMLVDTAKVARDTVPESTIEGGMIPLHPGAARYFKEKGLQIPERLLPAGG